VEQAEFAKMAGISLETVKRLERFRGVVEANTRTLRAIEDAFARIGIVFLSETDTVSVRMNVKERSSVPSAQTPAAGESPQARPLLRLIYFSTATATAAESLDRAVQQILQAARPRNKSLGIGSALLASEGRFLQVIEGPGELVCQIFGAVSADKRHTCVQIVQTRAVDFRLIPEAGMSAGVFTRRDEIFSDEPSMSGGFRPETLSPTAALALLGMVGRYARRFEPA
jgi:hypothetical protein